MNIRKRADGGYSIVELLTVVAIIGIIVLVTVPNFAQYMRMAKLKGAMRQLTYDIRSARQRAVSRNEYTRVRFTFSAKTSAYVIEESSDSGVTWSTKPVVTKSVVAPLSLAKGNTDAIVFRQDGSTVIADPLVSTQTVLIKSSDKIPVQQYTVTVERYGRLTAS
jgi:prepilin-type N-terminal cleavage/methylation domain-containing protein